jgi:5-methylcytosine-specific restriction endonuclease McrA
MPHKDLDARRSYMREYDRNRQKKKAAIAREKYRLNPEVKRQQNREWYAAHSEVKRAYHQKNRDRILRQQQERRITGGEMIKARKREAYWRNIEKSRQRERDRYPKREVAHKAYCLMYYRQNSEALKARNREYNKAHLEQRRAAAKARYWAKRDELREKNQAWRAVHGKEWAKAYRQANPEKCKAFSIRGRTLRRARLRAVRIGDKAELTSYYERVYTAVNVCCFWCLKDIPLGKRTVDHYIPLRHGGAHSVENLRPCCKRCNSSKRDKMPEEFMRVLIDKGHGDATSGS